MGPTRGDGSRGAPFTTPSRRPAESRAFVACYAAYAAAVAAVAADAAGVPAGRLALSALTVGAVALLAVARLPAAGARVRGLPAVYVAAAVVGGVHLAAFPVAVATTPASDGGSVFTAVVVQAVLLVLVYTTFARPFVPGAVREAVRRHGPDLLDRHMRDWWGFVGLSTSVVLALGVGVAAGILGQQNVGAATFGTLAVVTFVGVGALWGYAFGKTRAVSRLRRAAARRETATGDRSRSAS